MTVRALCLFLAASIGCASTPSPAPPPSAPAQPNTLTAAERAAGWRLLFDGTTTNGWRNYNADTIGTGWQAVDGALTRAARNTGGDIVTRESFKSFELVIEWKLSPTGPAGNSGLFYRVQEDTGAIYWGAPEMAIVDNERHGDGRRELTSSGANHSLYPVAHSHTRPVGEWNHIRLIVNRNHVEHWLNGEKVVEYELGSDDWKARVAASKFADKPRYGKATDGHIGLQEHGSFVAFRNIKIRSLN